MADRTSARLFSQIFQTVTDYVDDKEDRIQLGLRFWMLSLEYDFSPNQMNCDLALLELELAHYGVDSDYPEAGETILYGPVADHLGWQ